MTTCKLLLNHSQLIQLFRQYYHIMTTTSDDVSESDGFLLIGDLTVRLLNECPAAYPKIPTALSLIGTPGRYICYIWYIWYEAGQNIVPC